MRIKETSGNEDQGLSKTCDLRPQARLTRDRSHWQRDEAPPVPAPTTRAALEPGLWTCCVQPVFHEPVPKDGRDPLGSLDPQQRSHLIALARKTRERSNSLHPSQSGRSTSRRQRQLLKTRILHNASTWSTRQSLKRFWELTKRTEPRLSRAVTTRLRVRSPARRNALPARGSCSPSRYDGWASSHLELHALSAPHGRYVHWCKLASRLEGSGDTVFHLCTSHPGLVKRRCTAEQKQAFGGESQQQGPFWSSPVLTGNRTMDVCNTVR